ncbi:hypothetical protein [Streptomyces sp. NPDC001502]|uniref:hypothetical protein n=1 Tax=Streptomyces sp. NPDC001502 TaxID=3364578 RepID=UPI0036A6D2B8
MTLTYEELAWAAAFMLAWVIGALLLCGITIIVIVALTATVKEHTKTSRQRTSRRQSAAKRFRHSPDTRSRRTSPPSKK